MHYHDHHKRSIAKAVGFLIIGVLADLIVSYFFTRKYDISIEIAFFSNLLGGLIYFFHERAWNKIHWGKSKIEIDIKE